MTNVRAVPVKNGAATSVHQRETQDTFFDKRAVGLAIDDNEPPFHSGAITFVCDWGLRQVAEGRSKNSDTRVWSAWHMNGMPLSLQMARIHVVFIR